MCVDMNTVFTAQWIHEGVSGSVWSYNASFINSNHATHMYVIRPDTILLS